MVPWRCSPCETIPIVMNERPTKSLRCIGATTAVAILVALQLLSQSLTIGRTTLYNIDGSRKLFSDSAESNTMREQLLHLEEKTQHSSRPTESETQWSLIPSKNMKVKPRAFDPWPDNRPLPCFPPDGVMIDNGPIIVDHENPVSRGFFFLKTYKTGSSTSAGVNLRIARNVARRQNRDFDFCNSRFDHALRWKTHGAALFGNRTVGESFLWGLLRDPTERAISQFFHFKVSRFGWQPTDENFKRALRVDKKNNYVRSLSLRRFMDDEHDGHDFANQIIQDYDFIGVTERIDESFVALAMLLRIPLSDVLYLSAKLNGGYDDHCFFIQPSFLTPGMKEFIESDEWKGIIKEDLALYKAANHSLDLTIERLGRNNFEKNLILYKAALAEGNRRCKDKTVFPCTNDGKLVPPLETDCLWSDAGCGAVCLDEVATDMQLDELFWNPPSKWKDSNHPADVNNERRLWKPYPS